MTGSTNNVIRSTGGQTNNMTGSTNNMIRSTTWLAQPTMWSEALVDKLTTWLAQPTMWSEALHDWLNQQCDQKHYMTGSTNNVIRSTTWLAQPTMWSEALVDKLTTWLAQPTMWSCMGHQNHKIPIYSWEMLRNFSRISTGLCASKWHWFGADKCTIALKASWVNSYSVPESIDRSAISAIVLFPISMSIKPISNNYTSNYYTLSWPWTISSWPYNIDRSAIWGHSFGPSVVSGIISWFFRLVPVIEENQVNQIHDKSLKRRLIDSREMSR